ncbi:hypothetical protein ACFSE0_21520 [Ochrobactrum teleogrylli]|uniref:Uncharacterized protein n=1 Tax=Ochrobactrum teleogrylli TaxID=2479765 RepID=A0ABY2Y3B5_9HYPH|nr:hypothetical protein [[Ochrobactrum] teleogrylli]TNV15110.1 hypothetical protein FIC94_13270 [[Ochrobactrum] teleogrylli]
MSKFIMSFVVVASVFSFGAASANACVLSGENVFKCGQDCAKSSSDWGYIGCFATAVNPFANRK